MNWSLFLLLLFVLCTIVISVRVLVAYQKTKKAIYGALINTIKCGEDLCPPVTPLLQPMPVRITTNELDLPTAKYCSTLVYALETATRQQTTPQYPPAVTILGGLQANDLDPMSGAVLLGSAVLWVVFRGSQTTDDWQTDFELNQSSFLTTRSTRRHFLPDSIRLHQGFADRYQQIRAQLLDTVKPYGTATKIVVTGHSLGAALATLAGLDLFMNGYQHIIVYTFASPRVGDQSFAKLVDRSIKVYRFVNETDLIPTLPLAVQPNLLVPASPSEYSHCGQELPFSDNWFSLLNNHSMPVYMKGLESFG